MAGDNKTIGRFELVGIPPAPRGVPQIEVTFDIDANGILNVSAKDLGTGKEQSIRITASSGLSEEEIDKMVKEAEAHASEDSAKRELIEARNQADVIIYTTEKSLKENPDAVDADTKKKIEDALAELKTAMEGEDKDAINSKMEALAQSAHKLAEAMYAKAEAEGGEPADDTGTEDENVVDAEFEEVDDDKEDEKK
jgi:molecular chaperone DnaK